MTAIALTIAGSDSSGGAGIQADLKTFAALGVYGASVITALTAQNTQGVSAIHEVPPGFITAQIDAVFSDLAIEADAWSATAAALLMLGVAGELAAAQAKGPASFAMALIDTLHSLDEPTLLARARVT